MAEPTPKTRAAPAASAELRQAKSEARALRKALQQLSDGVLLYLHQFDAAMRMPDGPARGKRLAQLANGLELTNDGVRFGPLGVDHRRDDKARVVRRLQCLQPAS